MRPQAALTSLALVIALVLAGHPASAQSPLRRETSRPAPSPKLGNLTVPIQRYPSVGDTRFLPPDITQRSTKGVPGFDPKAEKPTTRVQIGGPNGANVLEQVVNATPLPSSDQQTPFWTQDEQFLFYVSNAGGAYQIVRLPAGAVNNPSLPSNTPPTPITAETGADHRFPAIDTNGARIAFVKSVDGKAITDASKVWHLYVADLPRDGQTIATDPSLGNPSNLQALTLGRTFRGKAIETVQRPAWVGATDVVFSARLAGETSFHLFSVSTLTRTLIQITSGPGDERNPSVSPDLRFVAFDSNARPSVTDAAYTGGTLPVSEVSDGDPARAIAVNASGRRNIFVASPLGLNPTQFTGRYAGAPDLDNVQPSWSSLRSNPFTNAVGSNYYLAYASRRRSNDTNGFVAADTYDIYMSPASRDRGATLLTEGLPTGANGAKLLDTADPAFQFNDEYPTWSPVVNISRVAFQSDRTGSLQVNNFGSGFTKTATHDLLLASVVDTSAPTLVRFDTGTSTGEIVHINLGSSYNAGGSVRTREDGLLPGQRVFFTVRVDDRESGIQSAYLQFKNPNSRYQSLAQGGQGVERKEYQDGSYIFFSGNPLGRLFWENTTTGELVGHEYEAQVIALDGSRYYRHRFGIGGYNGGQAPTFGQIYEAGWDDFTAFSGSNFPPLDGQNGRPNAWLKLEPLKDESGNPITPADGRGGVLYGASWTLPSEASDWYTDVILYDNAVNPFNSGSRSNWIIYDNIWGFSTALPLSPQQQDVLVVADHTLGQKFFASRTSRITGEPINLQPIGFGAESYYTDPDMMRYPSEQPFPDGDIAKFVANTSGGRSLVGATAPLPTGTNPAANTFYVWSSVGPFFRTPVGVLPDGVNDSRGFFRYGPQGVVANPGVPNPLGVGSYMDEQDVDFIPTGVHENGERYALPTPGRYSIWRVLSRGPIPDAVLQAYLPSQVTTPPDRQVSETADRTVTVYNRLVVWAAPFTGNNFVGAGSVLDLRTQEKLTSFVNNGGRLFIAGQDLAFALGGSGQSSSFLTTILKSTYVSDTLTGRVNLRTGIAVSGSPINTGATGYAGELRTDPWQRLQFAYGTTTAGATWDYNPPSAARIPISSIGPLSSEVATSTGDSSPASDGTLGYVDIVAGLGGAGNTKDFNFDGNDATGGIFVNEFTGGGRVVYASLGFESIGLGWNGPYGISTGGTPSITYNIYANTGKRAQIMTNFTYGFRTGTLVGQLTDDQGSPVAGALVRAVRSLAEESLAAVATGVTDANGNFILPGLKPDFYYVFAAATGFYSQHSRATAVHGASTARANIVLKRANPGSFTGLPTTNPTTQGGVFGIDGRTGLGNIEVQARYIDPATGKISVYRAITSDGTDGRTAGAYSFPSLLIGNYRVYVNWPTAIDSSGNESPNPSYSPGYGSLRLGLQPQEGVTLGIGTAVIDANTSGTGEPDPRLVIEADKTAQINFVLAGAPQVATGKVVDSADSSGIPGATVSAVNEKGETIASATTDANGDYTLLTIATPQTNQIPAGAYTVSASVLGYNSASVTVNIGGLGAVTVPTIRLTRIPPGSVSGLVLGATGSGGVVGASVKLFYIKADGTIEATPQFETVTVAQATDARGAYNFQIANVPAGNYRVVVEKEGLVSDPVYVTITVVSGTDTRITTQFRLLPPKIYGDGVQLISVPFDYSSTGLASSEIFGLTPNGDNDGDGVPNTARDQALYSAFRVADWTGTDYNVGKDVPILVGKGYFVQFGGVTSVSRTGNGLVQPTRQISLAPGWNLIGHPFVSRASATTPAPDLDINQNATVTDESGATYPMEEAIRRGLVSGKLFTYTGSTNGSQYVQTGLIKPWLGYWFRNTNPTGRPITLNLNYPETRAVRVGQQPKTLTRAQVDTIVTRSIVSKGTTDWRLQLAVRQGDLQDTDNSIGVSPRASDGFDNIHDVQKPPMIDQVPSVYLAIDGVNESGRSAPLADSIRAPGGKKSWDLTVQASREGEVTVYWPNINRLPRGIEPYLIDLTTGKRVNMRSGASSFRYTSSGRGVAHRFRVEVAPPRTAPLMITNATVRVAGGRAQGATYKFAFVTTQEADVVAEVQTLTGRTLKRLQTRSVAGSESSVVWDGRDGSGLPLPTGTYVLTLTARDDNGAMVRQALPLTTVR
jgi:Tol biopolymer transport system component